MAARRLSALACAACLTFGTAEAWAAAALTRHPYPQNVQRTSVTLMWRTATPVVQSVQFSEDLSFNTSKADVIATTHHEITLTNLTPGRLYNYRVVEGPEVVIEGEKCTFRTDAGRSNTQFAFFVAGDVGEDNAEEARQHITQAMIRNVTPRAEFGLLTGDNVYPDGESALYDSVLMTPWRPLLANTAIWPALGNHDWHVDPDQNFAKEWALPNNEHYYSFDYGNAHFIALDTADAYLFDEANQIAWLRNDLASAASRGAVWNFVYYHHPLLTCTYKSNQPEMSAVLFPIFDEFDVDVVFTGHAHTYERLYPLKNGVVVNANQDPFYDDPEGTVFIVTGCAGKTKIGEPTTFCGPTAKFVDERILFTQVFVYDHTSYIVTFDSYTGNIVDWVSMTKSPRLSDVAVAPNVRRLQQNVPNPFNPSTVVPFEMPAPGHVRMRIFRADGSLVLNLADRTFPAGPHRISWDGRDARGQRVASGAYILRLQADDRSEHIKMMLVR